MQSVIPLETWLGVSLESWLTMLAIIAGPISALLIQKKLERYREKKERKLTVFRNLMASRASRLSPLYVQSLNAIEVEFYNEKEVIQAWRQFITHVTTPYPIDGTEAQQRDWNDRVTDYLNNILFEMARVLKYSFDPMTLKRNAYYPSGWGEVEVENVLLRKASLEVFTGNRPLKMEIEKPITIQQESLPQVEPPQETAPDQVRGIRSHATPPEDDT